MLTFSTFLLALVVGNIPVELVVANEVAAVELFLDGTRVARIEGPPWSRECDFGESLRPHSLVAVAFDGSGEEIGRVEQWVNMPRPRAEIGLVAEPDARGLGGRATLTWDSVLAEGPVAVRASFDRQAIPVDPHGAMSLPDFDPERAHVVQVQATFRDDITAVAHTVIGSLYGSSLSTLLTAIPVVVGDADTLPPVSEMAGWFVKDGEPLTVVAAEKGEADVVFVRDRGAQQSLAHIARYEGYTRSPDFTGRPPTVPSPNSRHPTPGSGVPVSVRSRLKLPRDQRIRLLSPSPELVVAAGQERRIFPRSDEYQRSDGGLLWILAAKELGDELDTPQPLAEAVATAAQSAADRHRRRAVVLVATPDTEDASTLQPAAVKHYLESARVPLVVWTARKDAATITGWGTATQVDSLGALGKAQKELERLLDRQRLVWVRGAHLPQDVELSPSARGVELLR